MRPLTPAPLPKWRHLFGSAFYPAGPDETLARRWHRPGETALWFSQSAWSLVVISRWQQQLRRKQNLNVWVPDYFCNASLTLLREMAVKLVFYPINDQMAPDLVACQELAEKVPADLFVMVHYFGQPAAVSQIVPFCEKHGAWLIEDATHVLQPIAGVGELGDCVLYSPHKHLSIPDGAVLVVRPTGPARLAENGLSTNTLNTVSDNVLASPGGSSRTAWLWLAKRLGQRLGLRAHPSIMSFKAAEEVNNPLLSHPRMSALARRLLTRSITELDSVALQRKQRALDWFNVLSWAAADAVVSPSEISATPYLFGFAGRIVNDTEVLFNRLQQAGLPVSTWPDLPTEVMANSKDHSVASMLRFHHIYLPVHQTLTQRELQGCGNILTDIVTRHWQVRALSRGEWERYWERCEHTNILQSWQYGEAKQKAEGWKAQRFLIIDENAHPIALAQVLTRLLPFVGGIARLNRGPLMIATQQVGDEVPLKLAALRVLQKEARRQRWWLQQVAPELPDTQSVISGMQALGYKKLAAPTWASGRISLKADPQALMMSLNGKWRNCMRKGEKLGVTVTQHECKGDALQLLIQSYSDLQETRGFVGLSEKLIRALSEQQGINWQFNLFVAREDVMAAQNDVLGLLVTIRSGDTALYLIGSANEKGRRMQANSVLLWQAVLHAKNSACSWFDIGGLSEVTPKGIAEFKQGLNSLPYKLVGEWRKWY